MARRRKEEGKWNERENVWSLLFFKWLYHNTCYSLSNILIFEFFDRITVMKSKIKNKQENSSFLNIYNIFLLVSTITVH